MICVFGAALSASAQLILTAAFCRQCRDARFLHRESRFKHQYLADMACTRRRQPMVNSSNRRLGGPFPSILNDDQKIRRMAFHHLHHRGGALHYASEARPRLWFSLERNVGFRRAARVAGGG